MINSLAEGIAFHKLETFIKNYPRYKIKINSDMDIFLEIMRAFRYDQNNLTNTKSKVDIYPKQLITLARYYYFHFESTEGNTDKVRKRMIEWISTFIDAMHEYSDSLKPKNMSGFFNKAFDLPFFGNCIPFDAIIREAVLAGELVDGDDYKLPSPEGLPLDNDTVFTFKAGKDKDTQTKAFWLRQLNRICEFDLSIYKEKKGKKATDENEAGSSNDEKYYKSAKLSSRAEAVYLIALWYAENFQKYKKDSIKKEDDTTMDESRYFVFDVYRLKRIFMAYSGLFEDFCPFLYKVNAGKLNTIGVVYASDASCQPESSEDGCSIKELPFIFDIDNGFRLRNTKLNRCYSISFDMIMLIKDHIPNFDPQKTTEYPNRDNKNDGCFRFDFSKGIKKKEIFDKLTSELPELASGLNSYICSIRNTILFDDCKVPEKTEENSKLMRIFSDLLSCKTADKPLNDEDYKIIVNAMRLLYKNENLSKKAKVCAYSIIAKNKNVSAEMKKLVVLVSKNKKQFKGIKTISNEVYDLFAALPELERYYLLKQEHPIDALSEIIARMRTLVMMMFDYYAKMKKLAFPEKKDVYLHWSAAYYLCVDEGYLNGEAEFKKIIENVIKSAQ